MIIDHPATHAEVSAAFAAYETALMTNDWRRWTGFSGSRHRPFASVSVNHCSALRRSPLSAPVASGGSPQRQLRSTQIICFGETYAVATTEFIREGEVPDRPAEPGWVKFPEHGWRIVSAHVSLAAEKS